MYFNYHEEDDEDSFMDDNEDDEIEYWSEPSYIQEYDENESMYTPGICVDQLYLRRRMAEEKAAGLSERKVSKPRRFLRLACMAAVCAVISAAVSIGVMEYRINRGDFAAELPELPESVTVVEIGGTRGGDYGNLNSIDISTVNMPTEDIYDMAITQVVGIRTDVPSNSMFGVESTTTPLSGSGFIITVKGYILTNYHVIEVAHMHDLAISVVLHDGKEFNAEVVGFDAHNDVALIKIDADGLNPVIIANSDDIRVGQRVYAVGNPFGELVYTMTDGIVSALDRVVTVDRKSINTFQFSAAVNSGNSGGPVYNAQGEVIGIVTAKLMRGSVEGIGFAIPINDAIEIAKELIEFGYITGRPYMGIMAQTASSGHAEYYGSAMTVGCRVVSVTPDTAADRAGLIMGDIITVLGDYEIDSREALVNTLRKYRAGDTVDVTVWRNGEEISLSITFDEDMHAGQPQRQ